MKKRAAVLLLAVLLAFSSSNTALAASPGLPDSTPLSPFPDLSADHWSFPYVSDLVSQGVVSGCDDGRFQGDRNVTWGEVFKLILLAVGEEEPERDPDHHWAYCYIQPALDQRLVYNFSEDMLDEVPTRLAVGRMACRALDMLDICGLSETPYADCDDGYLTMLYEKGIMEGVTDSEGVTRFLPDEPITREQIAAIVWRMMNTDISEGMFRYQNAWLKPLDNVPLCSYAPEQFFRDDRDRMIYSGGYYTRGIDVSGHKGDIDWQAVAGDGIDFAIIRAGNRGWGTGKLCVDGWFDKNMKGAIAAGLDVGAYFFSNAVTVEEALEEADMFLEMLEPYRAYITYPVVCDWEYLGGKESRAYGVDAEIITRCIAAFCQRVEEAGYRPMLYFNEFCGLAKMDLSRLVQYHFWYAEYQDSPDFRYDFQMWQYSDKGKVAGIGSSVDMDLCFVPYGRDPGQDLPPSQSLPPEPPQSPSPDPAFPW